MAVHRQMMTASEFDTFTLLPENSERMFELIAGEVIEVPSNPYSSALAAEILFQIKQHVRTSGISGHVTGEAGGYMVSGERYAPDVAFITRERQPELPREGYNPNAPDLAVEVVSPTDADKQMRVKLANYLAAGTTVWVVYPQDREIEVYEPGKPVRILDETQTLDGAPALPGFRMSLAILFGST